MRLEYLLINAGLLLKLSHNLQLCLDLLCLIQGGQQHAQSTAQLFGGMQQQQQQQLPQQAPLTDFQRLLQQALPQHQSLNQSQPQISLNHQQVPQAPASPYSEQPVSRPQATNKAAESPVESSRQQPAAPQPVASQPVQQEPEPVTASKQKAAAPRKAAPGPSPQLAPAAAPSPAWAMPEQAPLSLAGVQLEQQQQQQQQLDWGLPSEAPASPKKAEPKTPWGAAKPPVSGLHSLTAAAISHVCACVFLEPTPETSRRGFDK